jgi:hypothetical protein
VREEEIMKLPLEEAMRIQEALKPFGYVVYGYRDSECTENNLVAIDLHYGGAFPFRKSPNVPGEVGDIGLNESDNGLQCAE